MKNPWYVIGLILLGIFVGAPASLEAYDSGTWVVCWRWASSLSLRNQCKFCSLIRTSVDAYATDPSRVCGGRNHDRFETRRQAAIWMRDNCCRRW
jgi:hypothetical protein